MMNDNTEEKKRSFVKNAKSLLQSFLEQSDKNHFLQAVKEFQCLLKLLENLHDDFHTEKPISLLQMIIDSSMVATDETRLTIAKEIMVLIDELENELPVIIEHKEDSKSQAENDDDIIDDELVSIFIEEATEILEMLADTLKQWETDLSNTSLLGDLKRELHTLKGGARMVNKKPISELAHALESMYESLGEGQKVATVEHHQLATTAHDTLSDMIEALRAAETLPNVSDLITRLQSGEPVEREVNVEKEVDEKIEEAEDDIIDQELVEIYIEEATEILETLCPLLDKWREDVNELNLLKDLQRELHTLKGGARMINQPIISAVAHHLESLYEHLSEGKLKAETTHIDLATQAHDTLSSMIDALSHSRPLPDAQGLVQQLHDVTGLEVQEGLFDTKVSPEEEVEAPEAPEASDDIVDDELIEIYYEEAVDIFDQLSPVLSAWGDDIENTKLLTDLQRELHTLKGGARMVNQPMISELAHQLEYMYEAMALGKVEPKAEIHQLAVGVHDQLLKMIKALKEKETIQNPEVFITEIKHVLNHESFNASPEIKEEPIQPQNVPIEDKKEQQAQKASMEMIRVRSDILDRLNNLAGENSIMRVHMEQQLVTVHAKRMEMDSTSKRILELLKKLEIEAETKMMHKEEKKEKKEETRGFDLLEMDRYSQLQTLTRMLTETASDLFTTLYAIDNSMDSIDALLLQQSIIGDDLKSQLMRTRLVSFSSVVPRLKRIVRQVSSELAKEINLEVVEAEGEMDRSILDKIVPAIEHMLRNSIDHGIESIEDRKSKGKSPIGTIKLGLKRTGTDVSIDISDDGAGIDADAVKSKAIKLGLLSDKSELSKKEILRYILKPGFTTKQQVTQISGRGVGMDVVNTGIKQLGGSIDIASKRNKGTRFSIKLPFTLSVNKALLFMLHNEIFGIPLSHIIGISRSPAAHIIEMLKKPNPEFTYAQQTYPLRYLGRVLNYAKEPKVISKLKSLPILLLRGSGSGFAVVVDGLLGSREIVVKSLGSQLSRVSGCAGATLLGDGRVVVILDAVEVGVKADLESAGLEEPDLETTTTEAALQGTHTVMVVDDSLTVRKVTTNLLERHDYRVIQAKNGVDALEKLEHDIPDVMLLDVEMPRMDGFELTLNIRTDERFMHIPIIMITSRTGGKHKARALSIGVNDFMGKPYKEDDLLSKIEHLIQENHDER